MISGRIQPAMEETAQEILQAVENIEVQVEGTSGVIVGTDGKKYKANMRTHIRPIKHIHNINSITANIVLNNENFLILKNQGIWYAINKKTWVITNFSTAGSWGTVISGSFYPVSWNLAHRKDTNSLAVQSGNYIYISHLYNNMAYIFSIDTTKFIDSIVSGSTLNYSASLDPDALYTLGTSSATGDFNNIVTKMAKTKKYILMYASNANKIAYFLNDGERMTTNNPPLLRTMYGRDIGNGNKISNISYITDAEDDNEDIVLIVGYTQTPSTSFLCKYNMATDTVLSYAITNNAFLYSSFTAGGCSYDHNGVMIVPNSSNNQNLLFVDKRTLVVKDMTTNLNHGSSKILGIDENNNITIIQPITITSTNSTNSNPVSVKHVKLLSEKINFDTKEAVLLQPILLGLEEFMSMDGSGSMQVIFDHDSNNIYLHSPTSGTGLHLGKFVKIIDSYEGVVE